MQGGCLPWQRGAIVCCCAPRGWHEHDSLQEGCSHTREVQGSVPGQVQGATLLCHSRTQVLICAAEPRKK